MHQRRSMDVLRLENGEKLISPKAQINYGLLVKSEHHAVALSIRPILRVL